MYFSSKNKPAIDPQVLTCSEVYEAQGRKSPLVVVQEVFSLRHHTTAPQEDVGKDCMDYTKSEETAVENKTPDHLTASVSDRI